MLECLELWAELRGQKIASAGHPIVEAALRQETRAVYPRAIAELDALLDRVQAVIGFDEMHRLVIDEANPDEDAGAFLTRIRETLEALEGEP